MQKNKGGTASSLPRDILIILLKQFWDRTYIQDATITFLKEISDDLIRDIEQNSNSEKENILIEMIKALQGDKFHLAKNSIINSLTKVENWSPDNKTNKKLVFAEDILQIVSDMGPSGIDILLDAFLDDSYFKSHLRELEELNKESIPILERSLSNREILVSLKVLKNRRLMEEILKHDHLALEKISERIKDSQNKEKYEKLKPLYEKLQEKFSINQKNGFKILL
ncbi:MAG: hypothetical protein ACTSWX_12795 [Promethearchaeota archaeon]